MSHTAVCQAGWSEVYIPYLGQGLPVSQSRKPGNESGLVRMKEELCRHGTDPAEALQAVFWNRGLRLILTVWVTR